MSDGSKIEWLARPGTKPATWNPIIARHRGTGRRGWHCVKVNDACRNCYAEAMNKWRGTGLPYSADALGKVRFELNEKVLEQPLKWRDPRTVFVCSMTDWAADFFPARWMGSILWITAQCPQHTFIFLTKRADRQLSILDDPPPGFDFLEGDSFPWPLPNVWLGVTVHDQASADAAIPLLLKTPAAVRWVSYEPALGPVDFSKYVGTPRDHWEERQFECGFSTTKLGWIVAGGESGRKARPSHPDWFRSARDQCLAASVPFFFKQWGEWAPGDYHGHREMRPMGKKRAGRVLDGRTWNEFPVGTIVDQKAGVKK